MSVSESSDSGLKGLGIGIHELLRYGYGGLLAFALAGIIDGCWTSARVEELGKAVVPMVAIVLGAAIYVTYRLSAALGIEFLVRCAHHGLDQWHVKVTSPFRLLEASLQVKPSESRDAFKIIRDGSSDDDKRWNIFYREHSELHVIYITWFELILAIVPAFFASGIWLAILFFCMSVGFLVIGLLGDIRLERREAQYLNVLLVDKSNAISELLAKAGFLEKPKTSAP